MKAMIQKIFNILKSFFLGVRVAIELHIGSNESQDEEKAIEESQERREL